MKATYLAFYIADYGKIFDRLISMVDGSRFSHCELVIEELDDGRFDCISSSHRDGGIRRKNIEMNPNHWELVPVMCDIDYALRWYNRRKSFKYDYLALIRTVIPGFYNPEYRVFCSEACADMLELVDPGSYGLRKLHHWAIMSDSFTA
ncbi:hypothetical protein PSAR109036_09050 [Psychrobacter arenosus]|uniref:hypothetical protein n=2 Tax=Psychrobacter arenosus TaxID=256326 RepID=UPI0039EF6ADA